MTVTVQEEKYVKEERDTENEKEKRRNASTNKFTSHLGCNRQSMITHSIKAGKALLSQVLKVWVDIMTTGTGTGTGKVQASQPGLTQQAVYSAPSDPFFSSDLNALGEQIPMQRR